MKASTKLIKEQLVVLGWKEEHWTVLDKVTARNLQNDLVSFEVLENYERYLLYTTAKIHTLYTHLHLCWWSLLLFSRLIVFRLLSSMRPSCLVFFAEELQQSVRTCTVSIGIYKRQKEPSSVVLAALPSRDLSSGMDELYAQGYCGSPEQSAEILMREGEQLLLKFSGNVTSTGS